MTYLKKFDLWLFNLVSAMVVRWVRKNKFAKHKVDFFIMLHDWLIAYWFVLMFYIIFLGVKHHNAGWAMLTSGVMLLLVSLGEGSRRLILIDKKKEHDILFVHRKNPKIYNTVKELNTLLFKRDWVFRKFMLPITIILSAYILSEWPSKFFPMFLFNLTYIYQEYIFDFDEPEKKDKKVEDSVTDVVMGAWKNLIGTLAPGKG